MRADFCYFVYPELFPAGAQQEDHVAISWAGCKLYGRAAGHGDPVLLVLVDPAVYGLYQCGVAAGRDLFIFDFFSDGGFGQSRFADEHFRG